MKELIAAYDEYLEFLGEAEKHMLRFVVTHGFRYPDSMVERGKEMRKRIELLKSHLES